MGRSLQFCQLPNIDANDCGYGNLHKHLCMDGLHTYTRCIKIGLAIYRLGYLCRNNQRSLLP